MEQPPAKRPRISLACTCCRERKTRCDGERPICGCCRRREPARQHPCVYYSPTQGQGFKEIETLWHRISQLERAVNTQNPGPSGDGADNHDHSLVDDGDESRRTVTGQASSPAALPPSVTVEGSRTGHGQEEQQRRMSQQNGLRRPGNASQPNKLGDQTRPEPLRVQNWSDRTGQGDRDVSVENRSQRSHDNVTQDRGSSVVSGKLTQESPEGDNELYFYGEPSTVSLMQEVHETFSLSPNHADVSSNTAPSRMGSSVYSPVDVQPRHEGSIQYLNSTYLATQNPMNAFYLPARSLADHLFDCYFSRVHLLYPFLHQTTLQAAYEKLWDPASLRDASDGSGQPVSSPGIGLGNSIDSGPESKVFSCGMNAIFALSCQFSDVPILKTKDAAKGYLERAMALLVDTETLDKPNLSLVQVLLLLGVFLQSTSLADRCWHVIGLACRMAQGLELQVEPGKRCYKEKKASNIEVEVRRRVWYTCVMLDTTVSMTLGRVSMMSNGFSTPLPRAMDEEIIHPSPESSLPTPPSFQPGFSLMSFFIEAIKLTELTSKMVGLLYHKPVRGGNYSTESGTEPEKDCTTDLEDIVSLETSWFRLYDNIPAKLHWVKETTPTSDPPDGETAEPVIIAKSLERQRNVLHSRFLYVKMLLYRPLFIQLCHERIQRKEKSRHAPTLRQDMLKQNTSHRPEDSSMPVRSFFKIRCSTACFWAADELLGLVRTSHRMDAGSAWWYKLYYVYNSGIVVILTRFCPPLTDILGIPRIDESWVLCQEILKELAMYGGHANRCLAGLKDLRERLSSLEVEPPAPLDESQNFHLTAETSNPDPVSANAEEGLLPQPMDATTVVPIGDFHFDVPSNVGAEGLEMWDVDFDSWWNMNIFNLGPSL